MEVSVQLEALAFFTAGRETWYLLKWRLGGPQSRTAVERRTAVFGIGIRTLAHPDLGMIATPATPLQPNSYDLMLNNSEPDEGSLAFWGRNYFFF